MVLAPLDRAQQRRHRLRNFLQTLLLLAGMLLLLGVCAWSVAGADGVIWAVIGGAVALLISPRLSPRFILAMYGATPIPRHALPDLYRVLGAIAERADLPAVPRLYYVPSAMLNAFAVGRRDDAAIALTDGLLRALSVRELAGVLAHEVSHIRNNDLWVMNLADVMSRLTRTMAIVGLFLLLLTLPLSLAERGGVPWLLILTLSAAPTFVSLLQLALSRAREFDADMDAAGITGDPVGLASALEKLERAHAGLWEAILFPGGTIPDPSLLRTHPKTGERIRRLLSLVPEPEVAPFWGPGALILPSPFAVVTARPRRRLTGLWY
jgi:heat shock protein HtpX